jgi:hypothetical protein
MSFCIEEIFSYFAPSNFYIYRLYRSLHAVYREAAALVSLIAKLLGLIRSIKFKFAV